MASVMSGQVLDRVAWGCFWRLEKWEPLQRQEGAGDRKSAEEARAEYSCPVLGRQAPQQGQEDGPHLLQQPALLAQACLHLPHGLLEPAPLFLHVPLLAAQPLL